jgi:molybdenum cofactor cytidylyltransferase
MIAGIVLAAGQSRRFGSSKLLASVEDKPLIHFILQACLDSLLAEVLVVVDARSRDVESTVERAFPETRIRILRNENPERGLMSSVKTGIRGVRPEHAGAAIILADMPRVTSNIINTLIESFEEQDAIVIPECGGRPLHPRIIPRRFFPDFLALDDGAKGMSVIEAHGGDVVKVRVGREVNYVDIDRPRDLDALT